MMVSASNNINLFKGPAGIAGLFFAFVIFLCAGCHDEPSYFHHGLSTSILVELNFGPSQPIDVFSDISGEKLLGYADSSFLYYYSLNLRKMLDTIPLPNAGAMPTSINIKDKSNFAIVYPDHISMAINGSIQELPLDLGDTLLSIESNSQVAFFPKWGKLVLQCVNYHDKASRKYPMECEFLVSIDSTGHHELLHFKFPEIYAGPRKVSEFTYLSTIGDSLVISCNISESVFIYNMADGSVHESICKARNSDVSQIEGDGSSKEKRMEKQFSNDLLMENYGRALVDFKSQNLYRIFSPRLTEKSDQGRFHTHKDSGLHIIMSNQQGEQREYVLASGRYYMPIRWWCINDTLYHVKYQKNEHDEDTYYMDAVSFYNY